jgi:phytoene synthase
VRRADAEVCLRILAEHSKSFALAGHLLPPDVRQRAAAVYAWCRVGDDAVDHAPAGQAGPALARAREQLASIYAGDEREDPVVRAFQDVVRERRIPRHYPEEMLEGFAMDAEGRRYPTLGDLLLYCYRVAGTVGLMMCHVMGVGDSRALVPAARLGMAMQLTNICRDVLEDWERGRVYLPDEALGAEAADELWVRRGQPLPRALDPALRRAVAVLLDQAERLYRGGDAGLRWLSWRSSLSARAARLSYSAIGSLIARRGFDPWSGRAVVSAGGKLLQVAHSLALELGHAPSRLRRPVRLGLPEEVLAFSSELGGA